MVDPQETSEPRRISWSLERGGRGEKLFTVVAHAKRGMLWGAVVVRHFSCLLGIYYIEKQLMFFKRPPDDGDIVNIDTGVFLHGCYDDTAKA